LFLLFISIREDLLHLSTGVKKPADRTYRSDDERLVKIAQYSQDSRATPQAAAIKIQNVFT